jgi:hypothetical protein
MLFPAETLAANESYLALDLWFRQLPLQTRWTHFKKDATLRVSQHYFLLINQTAGCMSHKWDANEPQSKL